MTHSIDGPEESTALPDPASEDPTVVTDPAQTVPVEADPAPPLPDSVTVEETPAAKGSENVYMSITFTNLPRETAEQILQAAHQTAGQTSFSVFYDTAQEDLSE